MLLKSAPLQTSSSGVREKVKMYFVLALVDADTKSKENGKKRVVVPIETAKGR